jgi:CBS domain containing-hemolysin-like protein
MSPSIWLIIAMVATVASSVLSTLYLCLRDVSRVKLEERAHAKGGEVLRRRVDQILDDISGHANAILLPRILSNLIVAVAAVLWILGVRGSAEAGWIEPVLAVLMAGMAILVFGAVIPQSIANHVPEETVQAWSRPIRLIYSIMWPVRTIANFSDEVVRRLSGKTEEDETEAAEEELLSVVEEVKRDGQLDEAAQDMIEAVVEFRSTTVEQIMTPRTEMEAIDLASNLGDLIRTVRDIGHSRIPVYEENLDHIVGIFYVKDLMRWLAGEHHAHNAFHLREILRPAIFVPETKTVSELLRELLAKKVHIAIVADEFGGTAGIVTMEDIIEEVFGEIQDEYEVGLDGPVPPSIDLESRMAEIDARTYIDDANDAISALGVEFPESEDYDTVAGFVTVTLGRIPVAGERLPLGEATVHVVLAEPTRVVRVRIEAPRPDSRGDRESREDREGVIDGEGDVDDGNERGRQTQDRNTAPVAPD